MDVPLSVIFVFAVLVTAGATKLLYVLNMVSKLLGQELPLLRLPLDVIEAMLGVALVWAAIALFRGQVRKRWILQILLLLAFLLEFGEIARWGWADVSDLSLAPSYLVNWMAYLLAGILLSATSIRDYVKTGPPPRLG